VFERFTPAARRALFVAQEEAFGLGHRESTTGHLLLGLAFVEPSSSSAVLAQHGVQAGLVRRALAEHNPQRRRAVAEAEIGPELRAAVSSAVGHADSRSSLEVRSGHLLLAATDRLTDTGSIMLTAIPADRDAIRDEIELRLTTDGAESATCQVSHTKEFDAAPATVWALLQTANHAIVRDGDAGFIRSYIVPGTPLVGLGSQLAVVERVPGHRQLTSVSEVVEYDPGLRQVTTQLEPSMPVTTIVELEPIGDRTRVTISHEFMLPHASERLRQAHTERYSRSVTSYLEGVRRVLDTGWRAPLATWTDSVMLRAGARPTR
jgi:hypothetical protein